MNFNGRIVQFGNLSMYNAPGHIEMVPANDLVIALKVSLNIFSWIDFLNRILPYNSVFQQDVRRIWWVFVVLLNILLHSARGRQIRKKNPLSDASTFYEAQWTLL